MNGNVVELPAPSLSGSKAAPGPRRGLALLCVALAAAYATHASWLKWPDATVDFGRELHVASQLAEGRRLYVHVAHFLGPLSQYVNAGWFALGGRGLHTLIAANAALAMVLIVLLYRTLRHVAGRAACAAAMVVFCLWFLCSQYAGIGNYNYLTPYTHEAVHGLICAVGAMLAWMRYLKRGRGAALDACGVCLGLAALTRPEPFFASVVGVIVGAAMLTAARRDAWAAMCALARVATMVFVPILIAIFALAAHMPFRLAMRAALSGLLTPLTTDVAGLKFFRDNMGLSAPAAHVGRTLAAAFAWCVLAAIAAWLGRKAGVIQRRRIGAAIAAFFLAAVSLIAALEPVVWIDALRPLPLFALLVLAAAVRRCVRDGDSPAAARAALAAFAGALTVKMGMWVSPDHYGFTLAMPAALLLVVAMLDWLPRRIASRGGCGVTACAILLAGLVAATVGLQRISREQLARKTYPVGTGQDRFLTDPARGEALTLMLERIERHVAPGQSLAVFPEGPMLNYLSRRSSSVPFTQIMPTELAVYGEARVLAALQAAPPDFVALLHKDTSEFGARFFGRDYGRELGRFLIEHYAPLELVGAPPLRDERFGIALLRKAN